MYYRIALKYFGLKHTSETYGVFILKHLFENTISLMDCI
jgi:hypothetical protein